MNVVISDTAEYGCYLFDHAAKPLLADYVKAMSPEFLGKPLTVKTNSVDNARLIEINDEIRNHPVEIVGKKLRGYMKDMKTIVEASK